MFREAGAAWMDGKREKRRNVSVSEGSFTGSKSRQWGRRQPPIKWVSPPECTVRRPYGFKLHMCGRMNDEIAQKSFCVIVELAWEI